MNFALPRELEAGAPPAVRDEVRMMVAQGDRITHARFLDLPNHLRAGDLLVVNASATIPAALPARRPDGTAVELHLSTPDPHHDDRWVVEVRAHGRRARGARETLTLPAGATATLEAPYLGSRLWVAKLDLPQPLREYLDAHGSPIRYAHEPTARPLEDHQTIFATEPGSAEMPSAGRPFTQAGARARCGRPASASSASRSTPASAPRSAASARTRSATASRTTPPSASGGPSA